MIVSGRKGVVALPQTSKPTFCRATAYACLLILIASACSRRSTISVEVFVTDRSGQALRQASAPIKLVGQNALVDALVDASADYLAEQELEVEGSDSVSYAFADFGKFFNRLKASPSFEGVFTDANGKAVLSGVSADDFVVALAGGGPLQTEHLWVTRVADARDGQLLLGSHNECRTAASKVVKELPGLDRRLATQLFVRAQKALELQHALAALRLAESSLRLAPSSEVASFRERINTMAAQQRRLGGGWVDTHYSKRPNYFDCRRDAIVLWPGNQRVGWEELQIPGNLVTTRLAEIEARSQEVYGVVIVRPGSQKFYRLLRSAASKAKIDWSCEPLEDDVVMEWDESQQGLVFKISTGAIKGTSPFKPTPLDVQANKTPVFFECRNHEVFYVNKDEFDSQVAKKLSQINPSVRSGDLSRFLKELQREEIGDANYRVDPKHLLVGVMALELKPDAKGENLQQVLSRNDQFQTLLRLLDKKNDYIAFLVRDDSFEVFRTARWVARQLGYQTGWESLREGEPIKFGQGGATIPAAE